jgi:hypothetical protein
MIFVYGIGILLVALFAFAIVNAIYSTIQNQPVGLDVRIIERPYRERKWSGDSYIPPVLPYSVETMRKCGYVEAQAFPNLKEAQEYALNYSLGMIINGEKRTIIAEIKGDKSAQSLIQG